MLTSEAYLRACTRCWGPRGSDGGRRGSARPGGPSTSGTGPSALAPGARPPSDGSRGAHGGEEARPTAPEAASDRTLPSVRLRPSSFPAGPQFP